MGDKNWRLAKENTDLKRSLDKSLSEQEALLKSSIKAEYLEGLAYKKTLQTIDENIRCIEECLETCKKVREMIVTNHGRVVGRTVLEEVELNAPAAKKAGRKRKGGDESGKRLRMKRK